MSAKIVIGLLFGALFVWIVIAGVSGPEEQRVLWESLATLDWLYIVLFCVLVLIYHGLRVWRWQLLLEPSHPQAFGPLWRINFVGFTALNLLPARLGELARPFLLLERKQVPLGVGLATVIIERMLDFLCMFVILAMVVFLVDLPTDVVVLGGREWSIREGAQHLFLVVAVPLVGGLVGLMVIETWMYRLLHATVGRMAPRLAERFEGFCRSFMSALRPLKQPTTLLTQVGLTLVIWSTAPLMEWLIFQAFHLDTLGMDAALVVVAVILVGMLIPAPPGFAGNFEAFTMAGLAIYGVTGGQALGYALVLHWVQFFLICGIGAWYLWRDGISFRSVLRPSQALEAPAGEGTGATAVMTARVRPRDAGPQPP